VARDRRVAAPLAHRQGPVSAREEEFHPPLGLEPFLKRFTAL
jgi:hypothetical protein